MKSTCREGISSQTTLGRSAAAGLTRIIWSMLLKLWKVGITCFACWMADNSKYVILVNKCQVLLFQQVS